VPVIMSVVVSVVVPVRATRPVHVLFFLMFVRMINLAVATMNMLFYFRFMIMRTTRPVDMLVVLMLMFMPVFMVMIVVMFMIVVM